MVDVDVNVNLDAYAKASLGIQESLDENFQGEASVDVGFSINAGADGDFFSLFKKGLTVPLYSHNWDLWKVSWQSARTCANNF